MSAWSSAWPDRRVALSSAGERHHGLSVGAPGVNLNLIPGPFVACCQARMLSEDGRCKTFDAAADGYSRGEGCGAVVLRTQAATALAASLAAVVGVGVNQDGALQTHATLCLAHGHLAQYATPGGLPEVLVTSYLGEILGHEVVSPTCLVVDGAGTAGRRL